MVSVEGLTVFHPGQRTPALADVSVTHERGVLTVMGPSGSGKSTLLQALAGWVRPWAGSVRVLGWDPVTDVLALRRALGYVPQVIGLPEDLTLAEYLEELARLDGWGAKAPARARAAMTTVHLAEVADRRLKAFSGGMKRRALLAQALLRDPEVLVVDNPLAGLDPHEQILVLDLLRAVGSAHPVIVAVQGVGEALALPGRMLVLEGGRVAGLTDAEALARLAEGRVWELPWSFRGRVLGLTVPTGDPERILVIADARPHAVAAPVIPDPEHGYLYLVWRSRQGWTA